MLPFALQPPFVQADTYGPFRVVEKPSSYRYWSGSGDGTGRTWRLADKRPVLEALVAKPADCYLVSMDEGGKLVTMQIAAAKIGRSLSPFVQVLASRSPHEFILDLDQDWNQFVDQLARETLSWQSRPAR